jgi:hypothetical protein
MLANSFFLADLLHNYLANASYVLEPARSPVVGGLSIRPGSAINETDATYFYEEQVNQPVTFTDPRLPSLR